jgi:O-antigen/teichoic acid export membrane protein
VRLGRGRDDLPRALRADGATEANDASRGSAIKLAADVGARVLGVAAPFLIGRALSVHDYGLFGFASATAVVIAEMADLGLQAISVRDLVARHFTTRALLRAKAALTAATIAALALYPLLPRLGPLDSSTWVVVVLPLTLYFTLVGWNEQLGVVLRVRGRRVHEAATILCFRLTLVVAVALAYLRGGGLPRIVWAHVASTAPALVLGGWFLARAWSAADDDAPAMAMGSLLRRALPLGVNGFLAILSLRIEVLALGIWAAGSDLGLFNAAWQLFTFLVVVPAAICAGAMPALTREALKGEGLVRRRTATTLAALAAPGAMGLALVPEVLQVGFGSAYAAAAPTLRVFALGVPVVFMNALLLHSLIAVGRPGRVARLTAIRTAVAALAAVVLVPRAGAVGAALGFVLAETLLLVMAARSCAAERFPVPLLRPLGLGLALSAPMAVALIAVHAPALVEVALGAAIYGLTSGIALKLRPDWIA